MSPVQGFEKHGREHQVWKLHKALYGLRQAGAAWHAEIDTFLQSIGLKPSAAYKCLYYEHGDHGLLVLVLYVDDILVAYQSKEAVDRVFKLLKERYDVKDLGFPKKFLGMTVTKSAGGIKLDQTSQIDEILHRFGMDTCRPSGLPIAASTRFEKSSTSTTADELTTMAKKPYRQLVGALLYVSRMTRPDIAFAVAQASQFCADPRPSHWIKLLKVLQYLCGNRNFGINIKKSEDT